MPFNFYGSSGFTPQSNKSLAAWTTQRQSDAERQKELDDYYSEQFGYTQSGTEWKGPGSARQRDARLFAQKYLTDTQKQWGSLNSPLMQMFQQKLLNVLNSTTPTLNTLAGSMRMGGMTPGGSYAIAGEQREAAESRNREAGRQGLMDIFLQGQGQVSNAAMNLQNVLNTNAGLATQTQMQQEQSSNSLWNSMINAGIGAGLMLIPGGQPAGAGALTNMTPFRSPGQDPNSQYWRQTP